MAASTPFRIGLIGFGNIGTGFVRHLVEFADLLEQRAGRRLELAGIADKEFDRPRDYAPPARTKLTTNWRELIADPSIHMIVELVGVGPDGKPSLAATMAREALAAGKHFATANKALIATYGSELHDLAEKSGAFLLYEASVGAGTPLLATMQVSLAPDRVKSVHGILNGTTNHILTRMDEDGALTMEAAIAEAQKLGYAEPDPSFDVNGDDAAYKIAILGALAFGRTIAVEGVRKDGITKLSPAEFALARERGWALKLLASAALLEDGTVAAAVRPVFVPGKHIVAGIRGVFNGLLIDADPIGQTMYYGRGAGQGSTGSGLLADVILAARHAGQPNPFPLRIGPATAKAAGPGAVKLRRYFRVPGLAASQVATVAPGAEVVASDAQGTAFITGHVCENYSDNLLGKLAAAGVASGRICQVQFVFFDP